MLITVIDNEMVAKVCSRTYLKFHLTIRKEDKTIKDFANSMDDDSKDLSLYDKASIETRRAYRRLQKEFKKKTGVEIQLTGKFSYDHSRAYGYGQSRDKYRSITNEILPKESFNKPLWVTPLKLAPDLKKIGAKPVLVTN